MWSVWSGVDFRGIKVSIRSKHIFARTQFNMLNVWIFAVLHLAGIWCVWTLVCFACFSLACCKSLGPQLVSVELVANFLHGLTNGTPHLDQKHFHFFTKIKSSFTFTHTFILTFTFSPKSSCWTGLNKWHSLGPETLFVHQHLKLLYFYS